MWSFITKSISVQKLQIYVQKLIWNHCVFVEKSLLLKVLFSKMIVGRAVWHAAPPCWKPMPLVNNPLDFVSFFIFISNAFESLPHCLYENILHGMLMAFIPISNTYSCNFSSYSTVYFTKITPMLFTLVKSLSLRSLPKMWKVQKRKR